MSCADVVFGSIPAIRKSCTATRSLLVRLVINASGVYATPKCPSSLRALSGVYSHAVQNMRTRNNQIDLRLGRMMSPVVVMVCRIYGHHDVSLRTADCRLYELRSPL
jgi:hypothetical protein